MRLQVGLVVVILVAIGIWMATRPGTPAPPDLVGERDALVSGADVLVAEFTSGSESPYRVLTRVGKDTFIVPVQSRAGLLNQVHSPDGRFFELEPGCWVALPDADDLPLVPALTIGESLRGAPALVTRGPGRYSYRYQWDPPRFVDVLEDLHALDGGLITATARSGAPGGPNGIFTIRAADPTWAAEARAIIARFNPSEWTTVRVERRQSGNLASAFTTVVARDCPVLFPWSDGATQITLAEDGAATLHNVIPVGPDSTPLTNTPTSVPLEPGLSFTLVLSPLTRYTITDCKNTEWFRC